MKNYLLLLCFFCYISIIRSQTFNDGILEYTVIGGNNVSVKKYNNNYPTGGLNIPNTVVNNGIIYTITKIEDHAFDSCYDLPGNLSIPNTVTDIGNYAFRSCHDLTGDLILPNSVTNIGILLFPVVQVLQVI
jgi:hypothetical protein